LIGQPNNTLQGQCKRKFGILLAIAELFPGLPIHESFVPDLQRAYPTRECQAESLFDIVKSTIAPKLTREQWLMCLATMNVDIKSTMFPVPGAAGAGSTAGQTATPKKSLDRDREITELKAALAAAKGDLKSPSTDGAKYRSLREGFQALVKGSPSPTRGKVGRKLKFLKNLDHAAECIPVTITRDMSPEAIDLAVLEIIEKAKNVKDLMNMFPDSYKHEAFDGSDAKKAVPHLAQAWRHHVFQKVLSRDPPSLDGVEEEDRVSVDDDDDEEEDQAMDLMTPASESSPSPIVSLTHPSSHNANTNNNNKPMHILPTPPHPTEPARGRRKSASDVEIAVKIETPSPKAKRARTASSTAKKATTAKKTLVGQKRKATATRPTRGRM
jgi:hypothetical protein